MPDLGEKISDVSLLEPRFRTEIVAEPGGERFMRCFSCGTFVVGCPVVGHTEDYNPRRIIRMAIGGMRQEVPSSEVIWRCPQGVHIPALMNAMRNIAVRHGHVPATIRQQAELLREHGHLYEITSFENERRQEWGLPPVEQRAADVRQVLVQSGVLEETQP